MPRRATGASDPCPVCRSTSGVARDGDGHSCLVCGTPRIQVTPPVARPHGEKALLERVKALRARRAAWGVGAGVATAGGAVAMGGASLLALFMDYGPVGGALAITAVLVPSVAALFGWRTVSITSAEARAVLEEARDVVTQELVRAHDGTLDGATLARLLDVPTERAEELLARAQVETFLDGDGAPIPKLRVEDPGAVDAEEEQAAARARRGH